MNGDQDLQQAVCISPLAKDFHSHQAADLSMSRGAPLRLPIYVVDAFSSRPFRGNPAAVCLCTPGQLQDSVRQRIAAEMNLSETAFVEPVRFTGAPR